MTMNQGGSGIQEEASGLIPLGHAVLLKMRDLRLPGGKIFVPDGVRESGAAIDQFGTVVAVGSECWRDEAKPRAVPGDVVVVTKFAGWVTRGPGDQELYRMVNDRDVFCKVKAEVANG